MNAKDSGRESHAAGAEGHRDFADFLTGSEPNNSAASLPDAPNPIPSDAYPAATEAAPAVPAGIPSDTGSGPSHENPSTDTEELVAASLTEDSAEPDDDTLEKSDAHGLGPELRDRAEVIGAAGRWFAGWCLRFLIIAIAGYVFAMVWSKLWVGILPVLLSIIVCTVLWPAVRTLRRAKLPNALAVILTILGFFALIVGVFTWISTTAVDQGKQLVDQGVDGVRKLQEFLQGPPFNIQDRQLNNAVDQGVTWIQGRSGMIASQVAAGASAATSVAVTLVVMLVLTFFFLKDGEKFLPMVRRVTGRRVGWHLTEVLTRCWQTLGGFIRTQALVSFIDAFFIGGGLVLLGVPLAGALAVLTFFAGFIPMVGAFVAGTLSVLIALVANDVTTALLVLLLVVAVQQLEGNVLQPWLQARAMNIHPVIVLLSVTIGGTLFGIIGAFLAVPAAAMITVVLRYLGDLTDLSTGERTTKDINFVTTAGTLSGAQSEQAAKRWQARRSTSGAGNSKEIGGFASLLSHRRDNSK
ncbi:AI-2E family transporter [Corynebacterium heidelbergense]|uniref:AI-2E family transporter n=1 Tax=Corynebacterium heidelbergense TaxID=2055947 RepID=A0A364VDP9_9CORY|nr:AI-2E family transporter [Corynebacterium heidelbergense]RAV34775.1 AI-2E family transporter [Corynebacterium heidelbergense]WCZ37041.1 pheromone autoinducer 2 transporter [Corynebacterium heidelbergense]